MIYILGSNTIYEYEDLEDTIRIASTKIDDILDYLYNDIDIDYFSNYSILVKENGRLEYGNIFTSCDSYEHFIEYTPYMFLKDENKNEFEYVKIKLQIWCDAVKDKRTRLKEERERIAREKKEARERKLYEELKVKYGD